MRSCISVIFSGIITASLFFNCHVLPAQDTGSWGAYGKSAFRDKPSQSYSSLSGPDGKPLPIVWRTLAPEDFGPWPVKFDNEGVRKLRPVPAAGVHPRIFFGPDDLPEIRSRLRNTQCGQLLWNKIVSWSHALRGTYDEKASYALPDLWKGTHRGSHGNIQLWYYHDPNSPFNTANHLFDKLASGDMTVDPGPLWQAFSFDAYRCLIENDAAGGKTLAQAVITAVKHDQIARSVFRKTHHETDPLTSPVSGGAGGQELGFIYDLLFNYLNPSQKKTLHDELADTTWYHDNYGTFNAAVSTRSNWATFSYWLIPLLAIEGEPGFNDLKAAGIYRGWRNMLTYGWFPSGATVEGEAKDQLGMDGIIAFARRRTPSLAGHPNLRAYVKAFLPHSLLPDPDWISPTSEFSAGGFTRYDLLGGFSTPMAPDIFGLKYMFPDDKTVDWVYRNAVGENYERLPLSGGSYFNGLLFAAMFPSDYIPGNNDPSKLGLGLSYLSGERGLVMTRSGWDKNAIMLNLHTRGASGGHPYADRNSFVLSGQGRVWFTINQKNGDSSQQSIIVIDHKSQAAWSPGRLVDYIDQPLATFAVGDAKYCWDWDVRFLERPQGYTLADVDSGKVTMPVNAQPEMHTINDFAYTRHNYNYLNAPLWYLHDWVQKDGSLSPVIRSPNFPVVKAFRSVGLIRGKFPYALIIDDIQKDESVHHYDWNGLLEADLGIAQISRPASSDPDSKVYDIILAAVPPPAAAGLEMPPAASLARVAKGDALLLIRLLDCHNADAQSSPDPTLAYTADRKKSILTLPSNSKSPDYKVLLFPYRQGDSLPVTVWNAAHTKLTVTFPGIVDTILFTQTASGKTNVTIDRTAAGETTHIIQVEHPIMPLLNHSVRKNERTN